MDYDKIYDIRLAEIDDIDSIMMFIDTYWKKNHIMAKNREYFEYQHVFNSVVTFILAIEKSTKEIVGVLGYIPSSKDFKRLDIWTAIWKVKDGVLPFLGMELYKRLQTAAGARSLLGCGDNPNTAVRLLKKCTKNFNTFLMKQFYILDDRKDYKIAYVKYLQKNNQIKHEESIVTKLSNVQEVKQFIDVESINVFPYKDFWYIEHRYLNNPIYKYNFYGLELDNKRALLITRLQHCEDSNVLRLVDYIGNQECFSGIYNFIKSYLKKENCEYADFYEYGFNEDYIKQAGFLERIQNDENIIPDYFSPFVRENIDIWCSANVDNCLFFKADGDQDRPN